MKNILRVYLYLIGVGVSCWFQSLTLAQVIPDNTLGGESSKITNIDQLRERIEGGAIRGGNLFHSFLEFNVGEGRGIYFANPTGIDNILSRVTGGNASHILGQLGVLGNANLFLLNPNGIIFGDNASLDIQGSFHASTAEGIKLGEKGFFSAVEPQKSNLLSVDPGILLFNQAANHSGSIINRGSLVVEGDLNLTASNLDLQGQLYSGGNLTLNGLNTVKIRDKVANPFVAAAMGDLSIQGNETVDIFALNHPNSGLFSGKNLVLSSANTVIGDAHYYSGGSFSIEKLDGNLNNLYSPNDPVIRSNGDVSFNSYFGASLHIIAGGKVTIPGSITITEPDLVNGLFETINLSNGDTFTIAGSIEPTLDIRAGVDSNVVGMPVEQIGTGFFIPFVSSTTNPTGADIVIGDVMISDNLLGTGGKVFLTNHYFPNDSLSGNITINSINDLDLFSGVSIIVDSRNNINVDGIINTTSIFGQGGDIQFLSGSDTILNSNISTGGGQVQLTAGNNIILEGSTISTDNLFTGSRGNITIESGTLLLRDDSSLLTSSFLPLDSISLEKEGNITIETKQLIIEDGSRISNGTFTDKDAGDINIFASDFIRINQGSINSGTSNQGNAGTINIQTQQLIIEDTSNISSSSSGNGRSGNISIKNTDLIRISSSSSIQSQANSKGEGGNIEIQTINLSLKDIGGITASTEGEAKAGTINIDASGLVEVLDGSIIQSTTFGSRPAGNIIIQSEQLVVKDNNSSITTLTNGAGNAGLLSIDTGKLVIQDSGIISTETNGAGNAGNLVIQASESIIMNGQGDTEISLTTTVNENATGRGGDLTLTTGQLIIQDGAQVTAGTFGEGDSGKLIVNALESIQLNGLGTGLFTQTEGQGNSNDLMLQTGKLLVENGATISTRTLDEGRAGILTINATEFVELKGINSSLLSQTEGSGNANNIILNTPQLILTDSGIISAQTESMGNAGNIIINAPTIVTLGENTNLTVETSDAGKAGDITITSDNITIGQDAQLSATATETSTNTEGGGSINLNTQNLNIAGQLGIFAETQGQSPAGSLTINPNNNNPNLNIRFTDNGFISARTFSAGEGGDITISAPQNLDIRGEGQITVETSGSGNAGEINMTSQNLTLAEGLEISASTAGEGDAGEISIKAQTLTLDNNSAITTTVNPNATGQGGNINIETTGNSVTLNNGSQISSRSQGEGDAGNITIDSGGQINLNDSDITTASDQASGGEINISGNNIILRGDSDIRTNVNSGAGGGGNINFSANVILAFDDSDILAFARDGLGGNITLNTPIFFGDGFQQVSSGIDVDNLDGNNRVDVNASGAISGSIIIPDITFIRNSLTELPENIIDTENLIANSCVVPNRSQTGTFIITGSGGLPIRPGDVTGSTYSTGEVRTLEEDNNPSWQPGDSIVEPQGVYRLPNGKLVLSREC